MGVPSDKKRLEVVQGDVVKGSSDKEINKSAKDAAGKWLTSREVDNFFTKGKDPNWPDEWTAARKSLASIMDSMASDLTMTAVMLVNLILAVLIVDTEASGQDVPLWMDGSMKALVVVYSVEVSLRIYVWRWQFFLNIFNQADFLIVVADVLIALLELFLADVIAVDFAPFRIIRIVRLLRSAKIMVLFRSLYLLINGMAGAVKAVLWALVMISLALILCSIFAVAIIQPYVEELATNSDVFDGCGRCPLAYSSVWYAYMTFFQQIVAGDSWGLVTIPIMDAYPWTAFFFIPALSLIQMGLINMILAVIVDRAQDAREANSALRLEIKEQELKEAQMVLETICASMDHDGSGELTLGEILQGYDNNERFYEILKLMDIGQEDMKCVFNILDEDKSGTCTYPEFVNSLWKMKAQDSHTLLVFIKSYVTDVKRSLEESIGMLKNDIGIKLAELHAVHYEEAPLGDVSEPLKGGQSRSPSQRKVSRMSANTTVHVRHSPRNSTASDIHGEIDVTAMLSSMSEKIESKLDTLSKLMTPVPVLKSRGDLVPPISTTAAAGSSAPVGCSTWQRQQQQAQSQQPDVRAAFCFSAESVTMAKAPRSTPTINPSESQVAVVQP